MRFAIVAVAMLLPGCAGIEFTSAGAPNSFTYREATPFAVVKTAIDCTQAVEVISVPGAAHGMRMKSGLGSAKLNVKLANGVITDIGQETDSKIPETITAAAGLAKVLAPMALAPGFAPPPQKPHECTPSVRLFQIVTDAEGRVGFDRDNAFTIAAEGF